MNRATAVRLGFCLAFIGLVAVFLAYPGADRQDRAAPARRVIDPAEIRRLEGVVAKATTKGLIHRVDVNAHQVEVNPLLWAHFDSETKRGFALSLAAYCDLKGSAEGRYVEIIDSQTRVKLASYGAGKADLASVLTARREVAETRIRTIEAEGQLAITHAKLAYFTVEEHS